ncbi:hypothetical protein CsSME_00010553 [Camellia sinensis var. sinensis]
MVQRRPNDVDSYGCLSSYNAAARIFNEGLRHLCEEMRSEMVDATIVHVDIYSIKYDLIANYTKHGKLIKILTPFLCWYHDDEHEYRQ